MSDTGKDIFDQINSSPIKKRRTKIIEQGGTVEEVPDEPFYDESALHADIKDDICVDCNLGIDMNQTIPVNSVQIKITKKF